MSEFRVNFDNGHWDVREQSNGQLVESFPRWGEPPDPARDRELAEALAQELNLRGNGREVSATW